MDRRGNGPLRILCLATVVMFTSRRDEGLTPFDNACMQSHLCGQDGAVHNCVTLSLCSWHSAQMYRTHVGRTSLRSDWTHACAKCSFVCVIHSNMPLAACIVDATRHWWRLKMGMFCLAACNTHVDAVTLRILQILFERVVGTHDLGA